MKKKSFLLFAACVLILLFISGWAGYRHYIPSPPSLLLLVDSDEIEVKPSSYSVEKWGRKASLDTFSDPIAAVSQRETTMIPPLMELTFQFEKRPQSIKYFLWELQTGKLAYKGMEGESIRFEELKIPAGDYSLEIRAKWESGYALYHTKVKFSDEK